MSAFFFFSFFLTDFDDGFVLMCWDLGRMFDKSIPACTFFVVVLLGGD